MGGTVFLVCLLAFQYTFCEGLDFSGVWFVGLLVGWSFCLEIGKGGK